MTSFLWPLTELKASWSIACVVAFGLVVPGTLNATGFCWQERRYLSDEELIHAFAENIVKNLTPYPSQLEAVIRSNTDETNPSVARIVEYTSGDDFLEANPNCCIIGRDAKAVNEPLPNPGLRPRLLGYANNIMTSAYSIAYVDKQNVERKFRAKTHSWINACGRIKSPFF